MKKKDATWVLVVIVGLWIAVSTGLADQIVGGLLGSLAQFAGRIAAPIEVLFVALAVPVALTGVGIAVLWRSKRRRGLELIGGAVVLLAAARLAFIALQLLESALHHVADQLTRSVPR
jgi:hypothetical protein